MRLVASLAVLAMVLFSTTGCEAPRGTSQTQVSPQELNGAIFEVEDAALASNCLSMTLAVRGFRPPSGTDPRTYFPPAKSVNLRVLTPDGELAAEPLGGGGGGGGDEEDGRVWMQQQILYSLAASVAEGQEVTVEVTVALDDDFNSPDPLTFELPLVAGPGGGSCP